MQPIQQIFQVRYHYAVHFTTGLFAPDNHLLRDVVASSGQPPRKALFVVDQGLCSHSPGLPGSIEAYCQRHADVLSMVRAPLIVPGGEAIKNSRRHVHSIRQAIHRYGLCRHSFVGAVGGGALLDVAGYAAATAHRGVRLIRVPTTVLAQNDSGVGVKNSINAFGKKNFEGTFAPPFAVLNDFSFLTSLPDLDWRAGTAEAVKVALIKDEAFFSSLERDGAALVARDLQAMQRLIYRCAELHLEHIANSGDPFEMGSARPLDFGHWTAHKLEQLSDFRLRHGEAVAIGIAIDCAYSYLAGLLPEPDWRRIFRLLSALGFDLYAPELGSESLIHGLTEFREHLGGELTITLLERIGKGVEVHEMDPQLVATAVRMLRREALSADGPADLKGENDEPLRGNVPAEHASDRGRVLY